MRGVLVRGLNKWFVVAGALMVVAASASDARAQLSTQHVKGSAGLKAGSEAPPGGYIVLPVFYVYNPDTIVKADGSKLPVDASLTASFFAAGYSHVTTKK